MSHAKLSPSSAERWLGCPGSLNFCRDIPNTTSEYAEEGTRAHEVAAARLRNLPDPIVLDGESSDYVDVYVNAIRSLAAGKLLLVEVEVPIEQITGEKAAKGTSDAVIVDLEEKRIHVNDLKFGTGVVVYADHNPQMMLYALGTMHFVEELIDIEFQHFTMTIHQTRRDHVDEWSCSREELIEFGQHVRQQANAALAMYRGDIMCELTPSKEACQWCPGKAYHDPKKGVDVRCPKLEAMLHETAFDEFNDTTRTLKDFKLDPVPAPETLDLMESWIKAVKAYIFERCNAGVDTPLWKMVTGKRGDREWTDAVKAEELATLLNLSDAMKPPVPAVVKSPAQLEKIVPKERWPLFQSIITQEPGRPKLVSAKHKGEALDLRVENDFSDLS